ncbi:SpoIIIAH-like family protein [Paenibacillus sp. GSMTC-2017]|uniref:SpoIIIAH-like family protein n=1 Tax=Paenibacillus sp. GSMTC-2017 TaxID=2794350 RepID=UPI0018D6C0CE|nr:SpoIIIAH-like family protein [Paenibacillus sp. GSMTC-2017]MBH5318067.1 SpoIIIAH-like family protein [Paenibacillus sp. GSMTC-2017]
MNTKRQTIWLVSMLSLMVVLSAYYLFTQDLNDADKLSGSTTPEQNVTEATGNGAEVVIDEVVKVEGSNEVSEVNQQVLKQLEQEGFAEGGYFSELLAKREKSYAEANDKIMSVLANVNVKQDESAAASTQIAELEEKIVRIKNLESTLMEQYKIALISEEENERFKVVVTSDKLEKKEAASIIDQVMTVMEVGADQVSVQYVPVP